MEIKEFRTTFTTAPAPFSLSPQRGGMLLIGSCFTDEMGSRLAERDYPVVANPCGVQYNPASIARLLRQALKGDIPDELFFLHDGRWRCWLMPTRFSHPEREKAVSICREAIHELKRALVNAEALVITFGTAWIYEHERGVVSNCHKVPAKEFNRRRLSVSEIFSEWRNLINELRLLRPGLKIIFTVSPIRHYKDGAHENTLSKATLHLAIDELIATLSEDIDYFPAWELLMDDLRDYRFYAADMLHPSPVAADYIFSHFAEYYFSSLTIQEMEAARRRCISLRHRTNV